MLQAAANITVASSDTRATARWPDLLATAVLALVALIAALTFGDYGLGWDDYTHSQYGDLLLSLYSSGFADDRALSFVNLYMYGGGFDLIAALAAKFLPFDVFATRRLVGAAIGLVGLLVTWRLGRRLGGPLAGCIALVLLAACPLYYGHMFINAKDAPFATANAIALLGLVRAFDEYPRARPATIALCGIGIGLAIGSRIMGGFAVFDALLPLVLITFARSRQSGTRTALAECGLFLVPFVPAAILAYLVMGLVWPWGVIAPLNPLRAVEYFSTFFEKPWREVFAGRLIRVPDMPRSYVPMLLAVKLPAIFLVLGILGMLGAMAGAFRGTKSAMPLGRRAALFALVLAATLPVLVAVAARPAMYNGIRHFLFVLPPLAALGGLAGAWLARHLERYGRAAMIAAALVFAVTIAAPVVEMVRLHAFEYTYFNRIAGGVAGASTRYMIDYWGLSLTEASRQFRVLVAERRDLPSEGKMAVCGPHPPVKIALGPRYTLTWDPKGADFAMMLGEYYCAKLNAPVLIEIAREGVVYARVYDLRGRSVSTLLTVPGVDN